MAALHARVRTTLRMALGLAALHGTLLTARAAAADESSSVAAATVLFDEGIKLMDAGRHEEACPKLARSQSLAPSGGTLLALGECYEHVGRTASAWIAFREAAARASSAGKREAELSSLDRARRLEPSLPRLLISMPAATKTEGLEVRRDGVLVKEAELGVAVPADPGPHDIEASAPHKKRFTTRVTARAGETLDVAIPQLASETVEAGRTEGAVATGEPPPPVSSSSSGSTQRVAGLVLVGAGVASLVGGGVFALLAKSKNDEALEPTNCPTATRCYPEGLALTDEASSRALVSTILVAVGATAVGVGGVLFFTAPRAASPGSARSPHPGLRLTPAIGLGSAGGTATVVW